jgi:hypothetical protein
MQLHQKLLALALAASVLLPLVLAPAPTTAQTQQAESGLCSHCATVWSVNLIEVKGEGRHPGSLGGGVVGALLNSQPGDDRTSRHFEVVLRMPNGTSQTVTYAIEPGFKAGDKVHIIDGVLTHKP